jgi:hypothetical protein
MKFIALAISTARNLFSLKEPHAHYLGAAVSSQHFDFRSRLGIQLIRSFNELTGIANEDCDMKVESRAPQNTKSPLEYENKR